MIEWSRKRTWIVGLAILVLTNVVALAGVANNRAGEPDAQLTLTERELRLPYSTGFTRENSGIRLVINWRIVPAPLYKYPGYNNRWDAVEWMDETKLDEMGFEVEGAAATPESRRRFNRGLPREFWLVLEYDGPAYQAMRERVKAFSESERELASRNPGNTEFEQRADRAGKQWDIEQRSASRLFVVDAGLEPETLREQYPDQARYIIARGQIRAAVKKNTDDQWSVQGYIKGVDVEAVNVPLVFRDVFEPLLAERSRYIEGPPRFRLMLAYGKRYEPWIVSVERLID